MTQKPLEAYQDSDVRVATGVSPARPSPLISHSKKILDYVFIYMQINSGAGIRGISRNLGVSPHTVTNKINRMPRNAILINQQIVDELKYPENIVIDGLQNFCVSQYFPDNYTIAVGEDSQFVYDCDYATIRRCGRMTPKQKEVRAELEKESKPPADEVKKSFGRLVQDLIWRRVPKSVPTIIFTDEKKDYQRAFWGKGPIQDAMFSGDFHHHATSSKDGRNQSNHLFPVNYMEREIRKDMGSLTRETVKFPRNVCDAMLRINLYLFDHNICKPYRINDSDRQLVTHAQVAGMTLDGINSLVTDFFQSRLFKPNSLELSESAKRTLGRLWTTPLKKRDETRWKYFAV